MKKILYMLLCILMLVGCTHQSNTGTSVSTSNSDPVVTTTTPAVTTTTNYPKPEYHDLIMEGDFSAIAGKYVNTSGENIYITSDGIVNLDLKIEGIKHYENFYRCFVYSSSGEGLSLYIYPIGKEIDYYVGIYRTVVDSDTSKIRIAYGNAEITSSNDVYTKKED